MTYPEGGGKTSLGDWDYAPRLGLRADVAAALVIGCTPLANVLDVPEAAQAHLGLVCWLSQPQILCNSL